MPTRKWTAEMDRQLAELWRAGESDNVIAVDLGRTQSSIVSRANRVGLGVRDRSLKLLTTADGTQPWTPEEDSEIVRLRRSGMSRRAIAATLGRSVSGIISRERTITDESHKAKKGRQLREGMSTGCTTNFMFVRLRSSTLQQVQSRSQI